MAKTGEISDGYTNSFWNVLQPYTEGGNYTMGAISYVGIETLVGQAVRKVMRAPTNWRQSAITHAISVQFLGQLNFGDPYGELSTSKDDKVDLMQEAQEGAKAIPAATVGFVCTKLIEDGARVPSFGKDFIYLCAGKVLSRPLTAYVMSSLPENIQVGLTVINALANRQNEVVKGQQRGGGRRRIQDD